MKSRISISLAVLGLAIGMICFVSSQGMAAETWEKWNDAYKSDYDSSVSALNLSPEKSKEFAAIADKYAKIRQPILAGMDNTQQELDKAYSAEKPDKAAIDKLTSTMKDSQDKLYNSYCNQYQEEASLLTPEQVKKYKESTHNWQQKMRDDMTKRSAKP
jgi:Spy/CpxP family protein refolding chaperone